MKKLPLTDAHITRLSAYGLQNMSPKACFCLRFSAGEEVHREGMPIFWLSVVVEGNVKVCRTAPNGKSLILCYYVSTGLIGEVELMTRQDISTSTVIAITDLECVAISFQHCMAELRTNILFLNRLGTELAGKLCRSSDDFTSSALYSGEQRLCAYILQTSHHGIFSDNLTDVSCSVGLSYRHMFRLLGQLCEDGILEKRKNGYYIMNETGLRQRSHLIMN